MCSRFELNAQAREVAARFGLALPPPLPNAAEIRPTDLALAIAADGARLLPWGLAVDWDKRPLINARAETLPRRATFRRLLQSRVLIPASAWWEWRSAGKRKIKVRLRPEEPGLFALAGLSDGERFTIATCAAPPAIAGIHDRMPVVLPAGAEAAWLDPQTPFGELALTPYGGAISAIDDDTPGQGDLFG
jgi:putative SOS response-associated peptidase YedK